MRKILGLVLTAALVLTAFAAVPVAADSENSRNNIGDEEGVSLTFTDAADVHTYEVAIPDGKDGDARNGRLTVDTLDCCIAGDNWGVRIIKANGNVMAEAVGNGGTAEYSGAATIPALPRKGVTVEVYYDSGIDQFPAGMSVRFQFTGENIDVTPGA